MQVTFAGVRECPPWCSIVGATVIVHQFFCLLRVQSLDGFVLMTSLNDRMK